MKKWTTDEINSMTVSELIDKTKLRVKLGAADGSGFVYCGRIDKVDMDNLDELIKTSYEQTINRATATIENLTNKPKSYKAFCEDITKKKNSRIAKYIKDNKGNSLTKEQQEEIEREFDISRAFYQRWLSDIKRKLETARTTKQITKRKLSNYTTIRSRQIVDCYPSILENDVTIVIYDGVERGSAWTTEEYETGYIDY